jgi:PAS domain S-box-containing protein
MATILVVDDRATNRQVLVTLLGYQHHRLLEASDGAEALAMVSTHHPDLVITDILMPTMDGYEFVRQLRADPDIAATAVIFYTAHYHQHEADAIARSCGVRQILAKPSEPEVILRVVAESLASPVQVAGMPTPQDFDKQHLRIVTDKLSETADNLRFSNERLAALIDINLQLASERDPKQMLRSVCADARDLLAAKHALLAVGTRNTGTDVFAVTSGMGAELAARLGSPNLLEGVVGNVYAERKSRRMANVHGDLRALGLPLHYPTMRSLLVAPIVSLAHVYGWICLTDKIGVGEFSAEDERLLGILAAQVGRIYENGSLYGEITQHAVKLEAEIEQRRQIQDALTASESRFRQMAENIRDVFFLVDVDSNAMLYISPSYEEIWGRSCESLYTHPESWTESIHPDDRAMAFENYQKGRLSGALEYEHRIVRTDSTIRWMKVRGFPVRDGAGKVVRIAGIVEDITERRQAERQLRESERRFGDMMESVELASVMLDRHAQVTFCNDYLLALTGWKRDEVMGRNWFETFIPARKEQDKEFFGTQLDSGPNTWHRENQIVTKSGETRRMLWHSVVLRSATGAAVGSSSIGEDITERKAAEEVVARRAEELERFHRLSVGRELQMIDLKKQLNELAAQAGRVPPYDLAFIGQVPS